MLSILKSKLLIVVIVIAGIGGLFYGAHSVFNRTIDAAVDKGYEQAIQDVENANTQEYKNVRKKADAVPKPRDVDDARRMLGDYLKKRAH